MPEVGVNFWQQRPLLALDFWTPPPHALPVLQLLEIVTLLITFLNSTDACWVYQFAAKLVFPIGDINTILDDLQVRLYIPSARDLFSRPKSVLKWPTYSYDLRRDEGASQTHTSCIFFTLNCENGRIHYI